MIGDVVRKRWRLSVLGACGVGYEGMIAWLQEGTTGAQNVVQSGSLLETISV
jgi:hypothetical protein